MSAAETPAAMPIEELIDLIRRGLGAGPMGDPALPASPLTTSR